MSTHPTRFLLPLLMAGLVAALFGATDTVHADQLKGTLAGESLRWHVLSGKGGAEGTVTFSSLGPGMVRYSVQGHREQRFATEGSVSLAFTLMNGQLLGAPEVAYFPSKKLFPMYSNDGGGELTIQELESQGDHAQLKGRYKGKLVRVNGIGQEPNRDDTLALDLEFDVGMTSR